ncbi:MAG: serine hydrolase domain-containing protein, partial [Acidimicrobiia bacterium]
TDPVPTFTSLVGDPAGYELGRFRDVPTATMPAAVASELQKVLASAVDDGLPGVAATVMIAGNGKWSGAAGTADGVEPVTVESQFGIGSITKTVVAGQILRLAEEGAIVDLDDQVSAYLPPGLVFDTNDATIRQLLSMRSGIPEADVVYGPSEPDPLRDWRPEELLAEVPPVRSEPGKYLQYSGTNYILLGMVIEELTGLDLAHALRSGMTSDPGLTALVCQPGERPAGPYALPFLGGKVREDILVIGGGYLPSRSTASSGHGAGCMASDSGSVALWGYLLFGGNLLSESSLGMMTDTSDDGYGLGVFDLSNFGVDFDVDVVGNGGWDPGGYSATLVVLPSEGTVICVLTNKAGDPADLVLPVAAQLAAAVQS